MACDLIIKLNRNFGLNSTGIYNETTVYGTVQSGRVRFAVLRQFHWGFSKFYLELTIFMWRSCFPMLLGSRNSKITFKIAYGQ